MLYLIYVGPHGLSDYLDGEDADLHRLLTAVVATESEYEAFYEKVAPLYPGLEVGWDGVHWHRAHPLRDRAEVHVIIETSEGPPVGMGAYDDRDAAEGELAYLRTLSDEPISIQTMQLGQWRSTEFPLSGPSGIPDPPES